MAKDPAFLFYPGDWQGGTSTFSRFLKGCYLDVLIAQFNSGHLSLEEIKTVLGSDFGQSWPALQKKFQKDDNGLLFNEKLDTEIIRRKEYSKSRADNRTGKVKKTHDLHMNNISNTYVPHMETGNGIEDLNAIGISLCKIFGKKYQPPKERIPAMANWYNDIDQQAKKILSVWSTNDAVRQIDAYLKHCRNTNRKLIGTAHKVAETLLASDWLQLNGDKPPPLTNKFENAEHNKTLWTPEYWEEFYAKKLNDDEFRQHFGYPKLPHGQSVGVNPER